MDEQKKISGLNAVVSLNDLVDLIESINSGKLGGLINPGNKLAACDYHCDCHHSYCACNGSVTALTASKVLPVDDYMQLRADKIKELEQQIRLLEGKDKR